MGDLMRRRPTHLDPALAEQLEDDFARTMLNAAGDEHPNGSEFWTSFTQASYVYDLLRSLCEGNRDFVAPDGVAPPLLEELMGRVLSFQAELAGLPPR